MRVRAKINFYDLEEKQQRVADKSVWECEEERGKFLLEHNAVEILPDIIGQKKSDKENIIPLADNEELEKLGKEIIKRTTKKKKTNKK